MNAMGGGFQVWVPMERFEEGLLLLARTLRWRVLDVLYTVQFDSRRKGAKRWDGKAIKPTPKLKVCCGAQRGS